MASIAQIVTVRDSTTNSGDNRKTGLTPTWLFLKKLADNTSVTQPSITEVGQGQYKFSYDAEVNGEATGQIDAGASLTSPSDRYIDVLLTKDSGRIQTALPSAAPAGANGLPTVDANNKIVGVTAPVQLDLTQAVPTSNPAQTIGDALNAARAQGFGKWVISGTNLTLYAANGSTVVRTFTLNSATAPTSRT